MSTETPNSGTQKPAIPPLAKKDAALNISQRGDRLYEINYLNEWFAISSLLFFLFTVWMILDDYTREWKRYQRNFNRMSIELTRQEIGRAASAIDRTRFDQLQQQLSQARSEQQQNEAQLEQVQDKIDDLNAKIYGIDQNFRFQKAAFDAEKYAYDEAVAHKASNAERLKQRMDESEKSMNEYRAELEKTTLEKRAAEAELDRFIGKRDAAQKQIDDMLSEYNRLQTRLNTLNPGLVVTSFRNAPVFDMFNPSERIRQVILTDLFYDHPFRQVPRIDRCTTCHLGIDQKGFEDAEQPFRTHPRMDLYLAADSPHPVDQFGCTSCHGGLDRAVMFQTAGHTPRTEEQQREWEEKYGWHLEHFLETPMLPMSSIESGCYKCHSGGPEVPRAASLNKGRDLIRIYGCFGCHKMPGYENVRKVGPDLTGISGKLTKEWASKWIRNPKNFKPEARMPQFWGNSNNSGPQWSERNNAEINAIVEYLFAKSKPKPLPPAPGNGNAAPGKTIVESVGCQACHGIGPIQEVQDQTQHRRKFGYNLEHQGSKVSTSWLYHWVKNPANVWPDTRMPNLRLTDQEAADVAAYLSTLKNPEFDKMETPEVDPAALDEVTLELLRATLTEIEAREKLKSMSVQEKNLFAGERLIFRYGCFGCHNIEGFEKAQPIGTELTTAGSKLITQLDFGFLDLEDTRPAWYTQKLKDPRIFDVGRVKRPEELLKMPNFRFSDDEIESIVMVLTAMVKDVVPITKRDRPGPRQTAVEEGRALIAERNCRGCHIIENAGGDIRPTIAEQAQWPPMLNSQGAKTQPLWLHPFLKDPSSVTLRPWLKARMPTFHFDERTSTILTRYFSALDRVEFPFISAAVDSTADRLRVGDSLFTQLQCAKCHPTSSGPPPPGVDPADLAPNLMIAHERLRPEWVIDWIADPQKIMPGTRMPTFFPEGQTPLPGVLGGDTKAQIQALRDHIFITLRGGRGRTLITTN